LTIHARRSCCPPSSQTRSHGRTIKAEETTALTSGNLSISAVPVF
jgi:hypothetical protein